MEDYLNAPIKELIEQFPKVGAILEEYDIGCVPCNVGTCLFKDIIEIHSLSPQDEEEVMTRIARIIHPGRQKAISKIKRKKPARKGEIRYSPPIKKLVDEHTLIKKVVGFIPDIIKHLDVNNKESRKLVKETVDFIRFFADRYHHAKEENILFKYFDESLDIIQTMQIDHDHARGYVKAIMEGLEKRNQGGVTENLNAYQELLSEHIKKEDEILYVWMDRNLSTRQVGELFSSFSDADNQSDIGVITRCSDFVKTLEERLQHNITPAAEQVKEKKL